MTKIVLLMKGYIGLHITTKSFVHTYYKPIMCEYHLSTKTTSNKTNYQQSFMTKISLFPKIGFLRDLLVYD